jgi:hypothetical protein
MNIKLNWLPIDRISMIHLNIKLRGDIETEATDN